MISVRILDVVLLSKLIQECLSSKWSTTLAHVAMFSEVSMAVATKHDNTNPGLLHFCCKTWLTFSLRLTWLNLCGVVCNTARHCSVWEASHLPLRTPSICFLLCDHTAAAAAFAISSRTYFHWKGMQGILHPFHPCPHGSVQSHKHFVWCVLMK